MIKIKQHFFKRLSLSVILSIFNSFLFAQSPDSAAGVNSVMRSNDKIYVVMAVCITILSVFFIYLIRIDFKVSKKEKTF